MAVLRSSASIDSVEAPDFSSPEVAFQAHEKLQQYLPAVFYRLA
jgi:hypothetical protein